MNTLETTVKIFGRDRNIVEWIEFRISRIFYKAQLRDRNNFPVHALSIILC